MKLGSKIKNILNELSELMNRMFTEFAAGAVRAMEPWQQWGTISAVDAGALEISGLQTVAKMGDRLRIEGDTGGNAEVVAIRDSHVVAMPDGTVKGMSPGDKVYLCTEDRIFPSQSWLGNVIASDGTLFDGAPAPSGEISVPLNPPSIKATARRGLGERLNTGLALFDTFLPLCRGQRVGLFAGSGVGKSTLIGNLAKGVDADIVIIALIGERSREVGEFVRDVLGEEGMKRSIVFASTCDEPAPSKRRTAYLAMAAAEYFRDQGLHVLLLFDSITRFADAHREIALIAGETPSLRAYPPSTFRAIAELAERPGPGTGGSGDITAVFTVLVAGSDMDEPVADAVRGILDGHVVMEREIAERGRYPAVNVRKSVFALFAQGCE